MASFRDHTSITIETVLARGERLRLKIRKRTAKASASAVPAPPTPPPNPTSNPTPHPLPIPSPRPLPTPLPTPPTPPVSVSERTQPIKLTEFSAAETFNNPLSPFYIRGSSPPASSSFPKSTPKRLSISEIPDEDIAKFRKAALRYEKDMRVKLLRDGYRKQKRDYNKHIHDARMLYDKQVQDAKVEAILARS
ncbi:hypothetical protein F4821DRAFT_241817 [Hypoxylon rubiginosum]|uniref:Uncharacterized protein n=1 Tax=Hypoxylon rubiginosum TaxID=110542 RepID=A0ACC0CWU0_9PEZI|nr:hypothetical protein F4821DRAFT_241817 [Hypoxylon rubiginosum]